VHGALAIARKLLAATLNSKGEQMDIVFITCAAVLVLAFADSWLRRDS